MNKLLEKILYVEDEQEIREVANLALETVGGFSLKSCGSGPEAVDIAPSYQPDLLLLDVMMPEMDGPATLEEIRKIPGLESVPVIFMTANVQPQEVSHYQKLGALDIIPKPFDPMTLAETVRVIWGKSKV